MRIHFVGKQSFELHNHLNGNFGTLISYVDCSKKEGLPKDSKALIFDSGAFSIMTGRSKHNLDTYLKFLSWNKDKCLWYANLDVIGNPMQTLINQKEMERCGFTPIPTFHLGSDLKYLKYYLLNYPLIGIGGIVARIKKQNRSELINLLDQCFSLIPSTTKIHAWGCTTSEICLRYPFYSVDSSSWISGNKFGRGYFLEGVTAVNKYCEFTSKYAKVFKTKTNIKRALQMLDYFNFITNTWTNRGVIWND